MAISIQIKVDVPDSIVNDRGVMAEIERALRTVSSTAAGARFAVLADPLRWPA